MWGDKALMEGGGQSPPTRENPGSRQTKTKEVKCLETKAGFFLWLESSRLQLSNPQAGILLSVYRLGPTDY